MGRRQAQLLVEAGGGGIVPEAAAARLRLGKLEHAGRALLQHPDRTQHGPCAGHFPDPGQAMLGHHFRQALLDLRRPGGIAQGLIGDVGKMVVAVLYLPGNSSLEGTLALGRMVEGVGAGVIHHPELWAPVPGDQGDRHRKARLLADKREGPVEGIHAPEKGLFQAAPVVGGLLRQEGQVPGRAGGPQMGQDDAFGGAVCGGHDLGGIAGGPRLVLHLHLGLHVLADSLPGGAGGLDGDFGQGG